MTAWSSPLSTLSERSFVAVNPPKRFIRRSMERTVSAMAGAAFLPKAQSEAEQEAREDHVERQMRDLPGDLEDRRGLRHQPDEDANAKDEHRHTAHLVRNEAVDAAIGEQHKQDQHRPQHHLPIVLADIAF